MKTLTKKQAKKYFKMLQKIEDIFYAGIDKLENKMIKETGVKDLEFFWGDSNIVGIGNIDKTMELVYRSYNE